MKTMKISGKYRFAVPPGTLLLKTQKLKYPQSINLYCTGAGEIFPVFVIFPDLPPEVIRSENGF